MHDIDMVEFPSSSATASGVFFKAVFGWTTTKHGPDYVDVQSGGITLAL